jgi:hypothetical protein
MSNSQFINGAQWSGRPLSPQMLSPQQDLGWQTMTQHPAYRHDHKNNRGSTYSLPPYQGNDQHASYYSHQPQQAPGRQILAELPGSTHHTGYLASQQLPTPPQSENRMSMVSELSSGTNMTPRGSPNPQAYTDRASMTSELPPQQYNYDPRDNADGNRSRSSQHSDRNSMASELQASQRKQQAQGYPPPRLRQ